MKTMKKPSNLKKKLYSTTLIIGAVAMLGGCMPDRGAIKGGSSEASTETATEATAGAAAATEVLDAVAIESITLEEGDHYEQIYVAGQLEAQDEYNVLPYTGGVVHEIMVEVGDVVEAGDVLYTLDAADLKTTRDDTLDSLQSSKNQSYNSLVLAQKDLTTSEMSLETAQKNYDDNLRLFEGGFITQAAMDGYEDALENAQLAYERSVISLEISQSSYDSAVDSYNNNARDFEDSLEDMTVTSPIAGVVSRVDVQVDVTNNMNAGVTVVGVGDKLATGNVIEKYINDMAVGQEASVEIKAVDTTYEGTVTNVNSTSSNSYYGIEVTLAGGNGELKSGMYAGMTINTNLAEDIITVPKTSVLGTGTTKYVFLDTEGTAAKTIVTVGRDFGEVVEITEGLTAGDVLVVEGQIYLEEGTPLIVSNDTALN